MYIKIPSLLNEDELTLVDQLAQSASFDDGAGTTGEPTKAVKNNLQLEVAGMPRREELVKMLNGAINRNAAFRSAVLPRKMSPPLLSKYRPGMHYGWHIDNAIMNGLSGPLRSDVACTVFLNDASSYQGGELMVKAPTGEMRIKLNRGDAFVYPATSLHQVAEVVDGERNAMVFWVQSMIGEASKREIIYELELAFGATMKENPKSDSIRHLQRIQANLIRMWSEV